MRFVDNANSTFDSFWSFFRTDTKTTMMEEVGSLAGDHQIQVEAFQGIQEDLEGNHDQSLPCLVEDRQAFQVEASRMALGERPSMAEEHHQAEASCPCLDQQAYRVQVQA